MDRQYIDDRHVVARYLADQLSDAERGEFEAFCAENPEVWREIEATAKVKVGLAKLAGTGELEAALAKPQGFGTFAMRHAAGLAAVGVGIVALIGAVYVMRVPAMGASVAEVSGRFRTELPVGASYEIMRMRDSEAVDLNLKLPTERSVIQLRVLPDEERQSTYQAFLIRTDANSSIDIAHAGTLRADENHFVSIYIDSLKLAPGLYSLIVVPDGERKPDQESSFKLKVEGP